MTHDKQLRCIKLEVVRAKQEQDQALNVKEFAVLAGISYSVAREWFQIPGFPAICGKVFWQDFIIWRRSRNTHKTPNNHPTKEVLLVGNTNQTITTPSWPLKAAKILCQVKSKGC